MSFDGRLTDRWSSWQLSWAGIFLPAGLLAVGAICFFLLPASLLGLLVVPLFAALGAGIYLTMLSACSNCGKPNGTRSDPWPARTCKRCGEDLTRPLGDA